VKVEKIIIAEGEVEDVEAVVIEGHPAEVVLVDDAQAEVFVITEDADGK